MQLTVAELIRMIPHGESMCMIGEVLFWDSETICCRSDRKAAAANPLIEGHEMHSVLLIEYGAQAAAIHAALLQGGSAGGRAAYLGAVRGTEFIREFLVPEEPVEIKAHCQLSSTDGAIYDFEALQQGTLVMRGRLILNQPPR